MLGVGGYRAMDDLASAAEQEIMGSSWPPPKGEYDETGRAPQAGEFLTLGLALTFEEVRGFFHDLVASSSPPRLAIIGNRSRNRNTKGQPNGRRRNQ